MSRKSGVKKRGRFHNSAVSLAIVPHPWFLIKFGDSVGNLTFLKKDVIIQSCVDG